jgi:RNA polymerase sigma-70 factor (ECF subfamily)
MPDWTLVRRVQEGDKRPFNLLVSKYQRRVESIVRLWVDDPSDISDIVQETFLRAYRGIDGFRGDSAFYSWLYRIAQNATKNFLIARARLPLHCDIDQCLSDIGLYESGSPEHLLICEEIEKQIAKSMAALPIELRKVIMLRDNENLSYDEMAAKLGCPIGTVRSRLFRARAMIDQALKPFLMG